MDDDQRNNKRVETCWFFTQKVSRAEARPKSLRFHLLGYPDLAQSDYYLFSKLKKDLYQKIVIDALETLFVDLENDAKS
jgi:hypothetical protein